MRIAFCSFNLCMRATQTALAARAAGHEVHAIVQASAKLRQFSDQFDSLSVFLAMEQMFRAIESLAPDVIYVHDRPHIIAADLMARAPEELSHAPRGASAKALSAITELGAPVVHDLHDMFSLLAPGQFNRDDSLYEAASIQKAHGLVFVSESNRQYAEARYGPLRRTIVVHSAVFGPLFPAARQARIGGAVWGGGLYVEPPDSARHYIDQREIVARLAAVGISSTVYHPPTETPDAPEHYRAAGAMMGGMLTYPEMLQAYSRHDFGWYGQTTNHPQIHGTIPNKFFEYVAAGIPVLVINADEAGKFAETNGLGVHVRRPEDVIYVRDRLEQLRREIWWRRYEFTREKACAALWPWMQEIAEEEKAECRSTEGVSS